MAKGKHLWIKIETNKGTPEISSYRGKIRRSIFKALINNKLATGFIKLSNVYWTSVEWNENTETSEEHLTRYGKPGEYATFTGDLYLRVEHIDAVSPLDGPKDLRRFGKKRELRPLDAQTD